MISPDARFVVLSGGVGGAKLALGLAHAVAPTALTIVANTGDDFEHLGLYVCPDLDSLMYTLAGVANPETGWGRAGETWSFLGALRDIGEADWFRLGDKDLAVHVARTHRLRSGASLTAVTSALCRALGIEAELVPMSDATVRTIVVTDEGELPFQHYFVRRRCEPRVRGFRYEGAASAQPSARLVEALEHPKLAAVLVCPSNPFVSIDPILAVPSVVERLRAARAPIVAVSPIVGGKAVKGPLAKMMHELGREPNALEIARLYSTRGLLDGFVLDRADAPLTDAVAALGVRALALPTVMGSLEDRITLAREVVRFALETEKRR